jgi:nicotinate phosphoribosyltransferase
MATVRMPLYNESLALLTDLYQMTMAFGYWKMGMEKHEAVFHHAFRKAPFQGGFTVAAGLESVIDYIENFRFDDSDLQYLATLRSDNGEPYFTDEFFTYLSKMKFSCDVDAVPEGTIVFPQEPLLRIQGPLIQCQLLESPILNLLNFPTLVATKGARMCLAAKGDSVIEFGLRRAQGIAGSLTASRAAYIGGCHSTSSILAGKLFGIPVKGTHSHSWVMAFDDELESFQAYAKALPNNCLFLVDTYDTIEGVRRAIEIGKWLKGQGRPFLGIRLDSGDLAYLSIKSRKMLDAAGFPDAKIIASNELDETLISELKRQNAQINVWGVGTNLVTAKDQPALDGVYKLSAIRSGPKEPWKYKLKLSEQLLKVSNPGILQVKRFFSGSETFADVIYDTQLHNDRNEWLVIDPLDPTRRTKLPSNLQAHDLLVPIFRAGRCVYKSPLLAEIRKHTLNGLEQFHVGVKRFLNPHNYPVGIEKSLYDLKLKLIEAIRNKDQPCFIIPNEEKNDD